MIYHLPNVPEALSREICAALIRALPTASDATADQLALRDERAVTALAHYIPENAAEAELAVDIVSAQFHAKDALCSAVRFVNDPPAQDRCRRQHALMMRTMQGGVRTLLRLQAERQKAEEAHRPAALARATGQLHSGVLPPEPEHPLPEPATSPDPQPPAMPAFEAMTEAEQYAVMYPRRAVAIRQHRGMPPGASFPPPEPPVIDGIVTGTSPVFLALDAPDATPSRITPPRDNGETALPNPMPPPIPAPPFGNSAAPA